MTGRASRSRRGPQRCSHGSSRSRKRRRYWTSAAGPGESQSRCWRLCHEAECWRSTPPKTWWPRAFTARCSRGGLVPGRARARTHRTRRRDRFDGCAALGNRPRSHVGRLARALRPGGILEVQCGGARHIDRVREVIETVVRDIAPELVGWSPWVFAGPREIEPRLREAGFSSIRCWLEGRPTYPQDVVRLSARRSSQPISPVCPRNGESNSPPPSWPTCVCH